MAKIHIFKCENCGESFETTGHHARWCPACRAKFHHHAPRTAVEHLRRDMERLRRARAEKRTARDNRLRARDAEYAKLTVPVTTRVAANGAVIETRGQMRYGSCYGALGGTSSEVTRKYL